MSALVFGHDDTCLAWLHKRTGWDVGRVPQITIGIVDRNGVLMGAVLCWQENSHTWEFGLYSEGVISPRTARQFFNVMFGSLSASRLQVRTPRNHKRVRKLLPKFGFRFECVARDFYGAGDDALQFAMSPDTCRWIEKNDEQRQTAQL